MTRHQRFYDQQRDDPPTGSGLPLGEVDPAQESLSHALRAGFNVLRLIMVVLLVAYFLSGWFRVNPGEKGLIVRLGKLRLNEDKKSDLYQSHVFGEGWHAALPDPFDEKILISGRTYKLTIDTFCFALSKKYKRQQLSQIDLSEAVPSRDKLVPGADGTMLSGDRNLSHGLWVVEYRIEDAAKFIENVADDQSKFQRMLRRLAENAIVRTVAGLPVERVIRTQSDEQGGDFTSGVKRRLAGELEQLQTGIKVINVVAKTIEPGRVRTAFLAVSTARSQRREKESKAREEANKILSKAAGPREKYEAVLSAIQAYGAAQTLGTDEQRLSEMRAGIDALLDNAEGEVAIRLRHAQSHANEIRERIQEEYDWFVKYRDMYRKYPRVVAVREWARMRDAILSSGENEIFFVPDADEVEIITNRDLQRQIQADVKRYRERYKAKAKQ